MSHQQDHHDDNDGSVHIVFEQIDNDNNHNENVSHEEYDNHEVIHDDNNENVKEQQQHQHGDKHSTTTMTTTIVTPTSATKPTNIKQQRADLHQSVLFFEQPSNQEESEQQQQDEGATSNQKKKLYRRLYDFYWTNEFLILVIIVIVVAKLYPPLGATYLVPDITATWIAVIFEFLMAGLTLETSEFRRAFQRIGFNLTIQTFNFGIDSVVVYAVALALRSVKILSNDLASGMIICSTLPMTVNMVCALTSLSNGDEAAAIFNAAAGNMLGVFLSPTLILLYIGQSAQIDLGEALYQLTLRVIVPCVVGQLVQKFIPPVVSFIKQHKFLFKQAQQYALVFIVYTVFCRTFSKDSNNTIGDIFLMIVFQFILLIFLMTVSWFLLQFMYPKNPKLRIMGLYGCTHKTVATGIPLINAIYGSNPAVGLFTLPLLVWHPMQLVVGTILAPRLAEYVHREQQRLGLDENDLPLDECITNNTTNHQPSLQDSEEGFAGGIDVEEALSTTASPPPPVVSTTN